MTVTTKFPTANEVETTGWTNPNNAHADDGVYATAAPAKNQAVGTRWLTWDFDTAIPASPIPTVTKVQIIYEYKVSTTSSVATMRVRAVISDVNEENHDHTTEPTTDTIVTVDITADRAWTRADLLNAVFKVTGEARRGNSNNAVTFSLDYIKVEVTWSANISVTPGVVSLTTALFAPVVSVSGGGVTLTPGILALALTAFAPTVTASDNKLVTPTLLALTLAMFAPTVTTTANQLVTPGIATLTLSFFAPSVETSGGGGSGGDSYDMLPVAVLRVRGRR